MWRLLFVDWTWINIISQESIKSVAELNLSKILLAIEMILLASLYLQQFQCKLMIFASALIFRCFWNSDSYNMLTFFNLASRRFFRKNLWMTSCINWSHKSHFEFNRISSALFCNRKFFLLICVTFYQKISSFLRITKRKSLCALFSPRHSPFSVLSVVFSWTNFHSLSRHCLWMCVCAEKRESCF